MAVGLPRPETRDALTEGRDRALGLLGQPGDPLHRLVLGRLGQAGGLSLRGPGRLLHRWTIRGLAGKFLQLLVTLPARPRADDETDGKAGEEREPVPHLVTSLNGVDCARVDLPLMFSRIPCYAQANNRPYLAPSPRVSRAAAPGGPATGTALGALPLCAAQTLAGFMIWSALPP